MKHFFTTPQGKGSGLGSQEFNLEVQTHFTVVKVHFYVPCIYCVLLGSQGRKHMIKVDANGHVRREGLEATRLLSTDCC